MDALREALRDIDPNELKAQITHYVPADVQQILATAGIRDEHVFPVPIVLETAPYLVGYYRLLLGLPSWPSLRSSIPTRRSMRGGRSRSATLPGAPLSSPALVIQTCASKNWPKAPYIIRSPSS